MRSGPPAVDVKGEALSRVIIERPPFAVPSDPVVQARTKAIEEAGGRPFAVNVNCAPFYREESEEHHSCLIGFIF